MDRNEDEKLDSFAAHEAQAESDENKMEETSACGKPAEMTADANTPDSKESKSWEKSFLQYIHDLIYLLAILIVVFILLFRVVVVEGTSMNHTLMSGDYLFVLSNIFYRNPKAGDIIVASKDTFDDGAPIVKRVIATEGQQVDIDFDKGIVYVDGVALQEDYIAAPTTLFEGIRFPIVVKENCVFVLGDNRTDSKDSRSPDIGQIEKREILGKVFFLFLPGDNRGKVERDFGRIGVVG